MGSLPGDGVAPGQPYGTATLTPSIPQGWVATEAPGQPMVPNGWMPTEAPVVDPNRLGVQQWAGNPLEEGKALGYEAGKGSTFGLLDTVAPNSVKENAAAYAKSNPLTAGAAQFAGSLIPGAIAPEVLPGFGAEATVAQRALANSAVGGGAGAIEGMTQEPGPWQRNGIAGGITGASTGAVLGALAGNIGGPIRKIVSGGSQDYIGEKSAQLIASKIAQDAEYGSPGATQIADALDRANKLGVPLGAVDLGGENLQSFAGSLYRSPGAPRAASSGYFNQRDLGATSRLMDAIDSSMATGGKTSDEAIQDLLQQRSVAARPLYEALYQRYPVVSSDYLDNILANPESRGLIQSGLNAGKRVEGIEAAAENRPFDPNSYTLDFNEAGDPVWKGTPNLRTWDTVKRGMDQFLVGDTYRNQYGQLTIEGRAINKLRSGMVNELDRLTGGPDGAYAQARGAWSGPSRAMEMIREGGQWMSKDPGQLQRETAALTPSDNDYYLLGVANNMRNRVLTQTGQGNEANRILNSPMAKMQAQALFEPDTYQALVDRVEGERKAFQTYSNVAKGSQMAARTASDQQEQEHAPGSTNALIAPLVITAAEHDPWLAGGYGVYRMGKSLLNWARQPSPAVKAEAASALTQPTDQQAQYMRGIAGISQRGPRLLPAMTPGIAGYMGTVPGEFLRDQPPQQARGGIIGI